MLLAIDTCGVHTGVALATPEGTILAQRTLPGRETQERLMLAIEKVLAEAKLAPRDLTRLAVTHGPGSFTGLRIGIAAIKGLSEALNLPVIAISRLQLLAARAQQSGKVAAWLDAGRGDVYVGLYEDGVRMSEQMFSREAARALEGSIVVGEDSLGTEGRNVGVPTIDDLVASVIAHPQPADPLTLDANYLRIPDAEIALKARS